MMGSALLIQFQDLAFERPLIPFIATAEAHDLAEWLSERASTLSADLCVCRVSSG
jgi:hypothetical protein